MTLPLKISVEGDASVLLRVDLRPDYFEFQAQARARTAHTAPPVRDPLPAGGDLAPSAVGAAAAGFAAPLPDELAMPRVVGWEMNER